MWDGSRSRNLDTRHTSAAGTARASGLPETRLSIFGIFAGIGGLEAGLSRAGHQSVALCESDASATRVLKAQFPGVEVHTDIRTLKALPSCDAVCAGFPCQDLSQVGSRLGIDGPNSGLVGILLELLRSSPRPPTWLILENVPFMLKLHKGRAIQSIVESLESMGWAWAYRTIDARAFGLPQRRRRVVLVASPSEDPKPILFAQDTAVADPTARGNHACGFYWTEGNRGLGWAVDAVPPLKGGSGLHIPSPPAIWFPRRREILLPDIRDAERLQGFDADWTIAAFDEKRGDNKRWRLVGNAVSVPMAAWIGRNLKNSSTTRSPIAGKTEPLSPNVPWPDAAYGSKRNRMRIDSSHWPVREPYSHLAGFLRYPLKSLSEKATKGFLSRLEQSDLHYDSEFGRDLHHHLKHAKKRKQNTRKSRDQPAHGRDSRAGQSTRTRVAVRPAPTRIAFPTSSTTDP
jgi:DNA (cytosine-5)-methyltransferase 1